MASIQMWAFCRCPRLLQRNTCAQVLSKHPHILSNRFVNSQQRAYSPLTFVKTALGSLASGPASDSGTISHVSQRGAHRPPLSLPDIPTGEAARKVIISMDNKGRQLLLEEIHKFNEENQHSTTADITPATSQQIRAVFLFNGVPFIGFGILDNGIMILAGEYIDVTIGAALGISTMAAAALGNLVSDVAGVGTAGYVEVLASKLGVRTPHLTPGQTNQRGVRWSVALGRAIGISLGCVIGMFPLLLFKSKESKNKDSDAKDKPAGAATSSQQTQTPPTSAPHGVETLNPAKT